MKTNSELPLCVLNRNIHINDYDFVLFHLYKSNELYRKYYKDMRANHPERLMILDNSAYEFFIKDEKLDIHEYIRAIRELQPDYYILPDVLMNKRATLDGVNKFFDAMIGDRIFKTSSKPMAVAQGITRDEITTCLLEYYNMGLGAVALPFHNTFLKIDAEVPSTISEEFQNNFGCITDDMRYAIGRIQLAKYLHPILSQFKHVHLLGSHHPYEKHFYHGYEFVKTMDTGYPVKCAIAGYELFKEPCKPDIIIDDFIDEELTKRQKSLIDYNVIKFKNL